MTPSEMVTRLMGYYKTNYSPERIDQLNRFCANISLDGIEIVFNRIIENRDGSSAIGVSDIKEACLAAGVGFSVTHFIDAQQVTCDACGHEFKYAPCTSDDDKIDKGIFDVCPMCGFQPAWTLCRNDYIKQGQSEPEWYTRLIEQCSGNWGPGKEKGVFLSTTKMAQERKDEKKRIDDAKKKIYSDKMLALVQDKRYDLGRD